jgi:hypothetical protein
MAAPETQLTIFSWRVMDELPLVCHQPPHKAKQRVDNPLFCF